MKPKLIPIKYESLKYPDDINVTIQEVPGHFDVEKINPTIEYSLHTDHSSRARKFNNPKFDDFEILKKRVSKKRVSGKVIPRLWYDSTWSKQFFRFIEYLVGKNQPPKIVEIHPPTPFKKYCADIDTFLRRYSTFEKMMDEKYPESIIAIENRGERSFLISDASDIAELLQKIRDKYKLKLMLDIPQLFTAHEGTNPLNQDRLKNMKSLIKSFEENKELIAGIHIWGRKNGAHAGTLDSLFECRRLKENFLEFISDYFDDGRPRYIVPEVNSGQNDFTSIVKDLREYFIIQTF